MKANATAAQADKNGTASAVETMVNIAAFTASSGDVKWTLGGEFPLVNKDAEFSRKLYCSAFAQGVYRSGEARKALPEGGGQVGFDELVKMVNAINFRGEEKPNKADKAEAEKWMKAVKAGIHKAEALKEAIEAKYPWQVEITEEGLTIHFMRKRLKEAAEANVEDLTAL